MVLRTGKHAWRVVRAPQQWSARVSLRPWATALLGSLIALARPGLALAQDEAAAAPAGKDFVLPYFVVAMVIGGGLFVVCRPSRRAKEAAFEREIRSANKEGANV